MNGHAQSVTCVFAAFVVRLSGHTISSHLNMSRYVSNQFTPLDIKEENHVSNWLRASFSGTLLGANSRVSSGKKRFARLLT